MTFETISGNVKVNDEASVTNAADSTDAFGYTRIFAPSVSGGGKLRVNLFVSETDEGFIDIRVHTVDSLQTPAASVSRVTSDDSTSASDVNFDGVVNQTDRDIVHAHMQHWRRNALHGNLVKRTVLADTIKTLGAGRIFWSPSGRYISFSQHDCSGCDCQIYLVASNPNDGGNSLWHLPTPNADQYDPSWSPLNNAMLACQEDTTIYAYSLSNFGGDGTSHVVAAWNDGEIPARGAIVGTISPDGQWVAFSRRTVKPDTSQASGVIEIFKAPISGDVAQLKKLTKLFHHGSDFYPQWSPDGIWIAFQRETLGVKCGLYRVRADGDSLQTPQQVYTINQGKDANYDATTPAYSPDSLVMVSGIGPRIARSVVTRTLDLSLATKPAVTNYPDFPYTATSDLTFPILTPILSPDGTRIALASQNVWAARRNMNLPPAFANVGGTVNDTTSVVNKSATVGTQLSFTVTATDVEPDTLTYAAFFLQDGMSFNPSTRMFSWTPTSAWCGKTDYVKFLVTERSGGSDAVIAKISVASCGGHASTRVANAIRRAIVVRGPNPTHGEFAVSTPFIHGVTTHLSIFDLAGRRIAEVQ